MDEPDTDRRSPCENVGDNRFMKAINARGHNRADTSPLYRWMWDNFAAISEAKSLYKKWDVYLEQAARDGIVDTALGQPITTGVATRTWRRVRAAKQRQMNTACGTPVTSHRDRGQFPSRTVSDWKPSTTQLQNSSTDESVASVARKAGTTLDVANQVEPIPEKDGSDVILGMDVLEQLSQRRKKRGEGFIEG